MISGLKYFRATVLFISIFVLISCSSSTPSEQAFQEGIKYSREAKYNESVSEFTKSIQLKPSSAAYSFRAYAYLLENKPDLALNDCNKAIDIDPRNTQAYNNRAAAYQKLGNFNQAIIDCDKTIEINPRIPFAYKNRALAYFAKKDYTKAWLDVHKAQSMQYQFDDDFIRKLQNQSGRQD